MWVFLTLLTLLLPRLYESVCIDFEGRERCWLEGIPALASTAQAGSLPLLIDLHGLGSTNTLIQTYGLGTLFEEKGFFVAWPQGIGSSWHAGTYCCGTAQSEDVNDEGFLLKLIETLISENDEIDSKRVYVSGHSNGCIMSFTMAIKHSDVIAAVGCFSGYSSISSAGETYRPMHSIIVQGTDDTLIRYNLVDRFFAGDLKEMNQCTDDPTENNYGSAGNKVETFLCEEGNEVALVTLEGVGHFNIYGDLDDSTPLTDFVWDFIRRGSLPSDSPEVTPSPSAITEQLSTAPSATPKATGSPTSSSTTSSTISSGAKTLVISLFLWKLLPFVFSVPVL